MPATKSLRSGTWARTLLPTTRSAGPRSRRRRSARSRPKNSVSVGTPRASADGGDVARWLDAQRRDPARDEVLEQVAIVAGQLDHVTRRVEAQPGDHRLGVPSGMLHPAVRVGREVGVLAEDLLAVHVAGQLDEQARAADPHVERIERLHPLDVLGATNDSHRGCGPRSTNVSSSGVAQKRQVWRLTLDVAASLADTALIVSSLGPSSFRSWRTSRPVRWSLVPVAWYGRGCAARRHQSSTRGRLLQLATPFQPGCHGA